MFCTRSYGTRNQIMKTKMTRKDLGGFTLVELLVVITIIGVIAGLAIPAIGQVRKSMLRAAMKAELNVIEQGFDSYKTKYGDYPPDFSDWSIVRRHYLKIFPDIAQSELTLLLLLLDNEPDNDPTTASQAASPANFLPFAMDRAEAVVWSLGGFSADPQFPFTGEGGPLEFLPVIDNGGTPLAGDRANPSHYQYRAIRNAPLVEFNAKQVTFNALTSPTGPSFTTSGVFDRNVSSDEPMGILGGFPSGLPDRRTFFPPTFCGEISVRSSTSIRGRTRSTSLPEASRSLTGTSTTKTAWT